MAGGVRGNDGVIRRAGQSAIAQIEGFAILLECHERAFYRLAIRKDDASLDHAPTFSENDPGWGAAHFDGSLLSDEPQGFDLRRYLNHLCPWVAGIRVFGGKDKLALRIGDCDGGSWERCA